MKIAIVTPDFPPMPGGVALSTARISQTLAQRGHSVLVVVPHPSPSYIERPKGVLQRSDGVPIVHVFVSDRSERPDHRWNLTGLGVAPQLFLFLRHLLRTSPVDVLHSFTLLPFGAICAFVAAELGLPLVIGARGNDVTANMFCPALVPAIDQACRHAERIAVVANDLGRYLTMVTPEAAGKIELVTNGVAPVRVTPRRIFAGDTVCFGSAADIRPKKDLGTLVLAFEQLARDEPHARLVIVGVENARARRSIRKRLGSTARVFGRCGRAQTLALVAGMDVFVIPSVFDGCPNALLEAAALARPLIVSRVGGSADLIVHDVSGLEFEPLDVEALCANMRRMLDPAVRRRLAAAGHRLTRSADDEAAAWEGVYHRAVCGFRQRQANGAPVVNRHPRVECLSDSRA